MAQHGGPQTKWDKDHPHAYSETCPMGGTIAERGLGSGKK